MGKSPDLSDFERGMIVGARRAGCSISETVSRLGFSKTSVSRVYREWCQEHKTSSQRGSCGRKRLVDDSGERMMESVVEANNRASTVQIQALYNSSGHENPISLRTTRRTLKRLGLSGGLSGGTRSSWPGWRLCLCTHPARNSWRQHPQMLWAATGARRAEEITPPRTVSAEMTRDLWVQMP